MGHTWLITGANGNLGKRLITTLLKNPHHRVTAVVRSTRARQAIEAVSLNDAQRSRLQIQVLDYTDVAALRAAAEGCDKAVHLVGILKESKAASYMQAHEASTAALLQALQDGCVEQLTYLSIVGSSSSAANACLASKGRAEDLCRASGLATCVLRVPMVLGEGDYASYALRSRACKKVSFTFRAGSMEQPIYAGDVVSAIVAAGSLGVDDTLDLGGPEVLSRRALTTRAAQLLGRQCTVVSLPLFLGVALAGLLSLFVAEPPFTRAMLEVLDHDDNVNASAALSALRLTGLTSLDDMLNAVLLD